MVPTRSGLGNRAGGPRHDGRRDEDRARRWGIEGAWNYGRGLSQHLVEAGEEVYEVNPRWTAEVRKRSRKRGKSDSLDARAVAELVWREGSDLPAVVEEDETAVLDLLISEREDLLAEATRLRNRIHQLLLQVDPQYKSHLPKLNSEGGLHALERGTRLRIMSYESSAQPPSDGWPDGCAWRQNRPRNSRGEYGFSPDRTSNL